MLISERQIKKYIKGLEAKLGALLRTKGHNEYAVLYFEGKIDALKSLLNYGRKIYELDEGFGL